MEEGHAGRKNNEMFDLWQKSVCLYSSWDIPDKCTGGMLKDAYRAMTDNVEQIK